MPGAEVRAGSEVAVAAAAAAGGQAPPGGVAEAPCAPPKTLPADEEEELCVICYDGAATCVLLECGHGGFCRRCAYLLFVRPPNECPTCRAVIEQVVEVGTAPAVGGVVHVQ